MPLKSGILEIFVTICNALIAPRPHSSKEEDTTMQKLRSLGYMCPGSC